jgi:glyoxylase-like metal-dependent hydrolase (beta-lactamase superfamily II)
MELTDNIVPLVKNLFWIKAPGKGKYPYCNGFLLTGKQNLLIDAGIGEAMIKEIDAVKRIDILLISHSHPDHMLRWHLLRDRHMMMPAETPEMVTDFSRLAFRFTGSEEYAFHWIKRVKEDLELETLRLPDSRFADGDIIDLGGPKCKAIHTPGHLNDHYCFLFQDSVLLTMDIDFDSFGPWYGNPESDIVMFKQSIHKIRQVSFDLVCSSHKPPISAKAAPQAFDDYLAIFEQRKQQILDLCDRPKSFDDLLTASPFYRNKMPDKNLQKVFEGWMIQKNLDLLVSERIIDYKKGVYQRNNRN